jgi:two-component system, chemotaxis family, chemotaxis protein CheY
MLKRDFYGHGQFNTGISGQISPAYLTESKTYHAFLAKNSFRSIRREYMSLNVLVADDSGTMRKIIIRSLQSLGIQTATEAKDGEEAVALFKKGGIDLVLTDWNMPGKTGLDVIRDIRADNKDVPIIMITTEAEKSRVLEAIQVGVSDYIIKPFEADVLREKLKKFVEV